MHLLSHLIFRQNHLQKRNIASQQHLNIAEADLRRAFLQIFLELMEMYEDPPCPLNFDNPFQLLCSVILSAQVYHCPSMLYYWRRKAYGS